MRELELLAPARNADIGIAAIDCGADAVYLAGPAFGARKDAGNSIEEIARLAQHAHRFGARVFVTVNTILFDEELQKAHEMMLQAQAAGADAFIVQDPAIFGWDDITVPLHASTQCAIRTLESARLYESLGAARLVLERQLPLQTIREIASGVACEIEFFVHGALCVCYSGQCYMSEKIAGRSANRGECIQACRSLYDLEDEQGNVLVRSKALLSLKDYNLKEKIEEIADAGVCSFKIEGRLKSASYVKNVVRDYSLALDELVRKHPDKYCRASFGRVRDGFTPDSVKTFNRGYTSLFIDGQRGQWASMNAPKSMGEKIGRIVSIRKYGKNELELTLDLRQGVTLQNGDGFAIEIGGRQNRNVFGFRGDVCEGNRCICKASPEIHKGDILYRNISAAFEKELDRNMPAREIQVSLSVRISEKFNIDITARTEDGREVFCPFKADLDVADNKERAQAVLKEQLSKKSLHYQFRVDEFIVQTPGGVLPFMSASTINSIRRLIASDIDSIPLKSRDLSSGKKSEFKYNGPLSYKANVANAEAKSILGVESVDPAYELSHCKGAELMRTKYCIRYELGMCPVRQGSKSKGPLVLVNNGQRFRAEFDCKACEMTII